MGRAWVRVGRGRAGWGGGGTGGSLFSAMSTRSSSRLRAASIASSLLITPNCGARAPAGAQCGAQRSHSSRFYLGASGLRGIGAWAHEFVALARHVDEHTDLGEVADVLVDRR